MIIIIIARIDTTLKIDLLKVINTVLWKKKKRMHQI